MSVIAYLETSVGPGSGQPHDIALVQALLAHIRDLLGRPYWPGRIDGLASDAMLDAINRFQEEFGLLDDPGDDIRAVISPASVTFQCLREATAPVLAGLRAVTGTATLYVPPRCGEHVLGVMTTKLRSLGYHGNAVLGRRLAALAERVFDRHRFLIRFPAPEDRNTRAQRVRIHFHGLKWLTEQGRLTSSEQPHSPVPDAIWSLVAAETRPVGGLTPEQIDYAGCRELWLRHDG
ncbi:peptidoglycan-binding domain-containing protein [Nisaea sp.]|uniref:peptidoglycan-binding domain-containing protein n=1 Tax=Nisaea sp. TaxID=2024842 RepID=UPI003299C76B